MNLEGKKILVTGAAGFIGYHMTKALLARGAQVLGVDELNDYYPVDLKMSRLENLKSPGFKFLKHDLNAPEFLRAWETFRPQYVLHFAAQAGVRYSFEAPEKYIHSNLNGFFQILEGARKFQPEHLIYATSSSVYGNSTPAPFSIEARADQPISIYAATKRSNELLAYSYSHLFQLPMTGLRFFTVYGSYGRPDMAYFKFTKSILEHRPITVYNFHKQQRDFTHVSDVVESILRLLPQAPERSPQTQASHRLLNIGASQPTPLTEFVSTLEELLGKKAEFIESATQPGDVEMTSADVTELEELTGYRPRVNLRSGLTEFVEWYLSYYL